MVKYCLHHAWKENQHLVKNVKFCASASKAYDFLLCVQRKLSGIFCLLRNQTQGQAISGYQRSDTGSRRKCWSHSTQERNRSLIGCAQTRSSFQQEFKKTKFWLKSSDCWVLDTWLYTHLHKLGIHCWASTPGRRHSLMFSGRPEEGFLFWLSKKWPEMLQLLHYWTGALPEEPGNEG